MSQTIVEINELLAQLEAKKKELEKEVVIL
jgi:hypothetical protein